MGGVFSEEENMKESIYVYAVNAFTETESHSVNVWAHSPSHDILPP